MVGSYFWLELFFYYTGPYDWTYKFYIKSLALIALALFVWLNANIIQKPPYPLNYESTYEVQFEQDRK